MFSPIHGKVAACNNPDSIVSHSTAVSQKESSLWDSTALKWHGNPMALIRAKVCSKCTLPHNKHRLLKRPSREEVANAYLRVPRGEAGGENPSIWRRGSAEGVSVASVPAMRANWAWNWTNWCQSRAAAAGIPPWRISNEQRDSVIP